MEPKQIIYKAGLLHDIGKFWQRTYNSDAMKEVGRGLERHPVLSEKFAKEWLDNEDLVFIVANHHEDDLKKSAGTSLQKALAAFVCEADTLASGTERQKDDLPYRRFFQAILSKVRLSDREEKFWKQPLGRLNTADYNFPFEDKNDGDTMLQQYKAQWELLKEEASHINNIHPDSLLYLCKKYLWCIPSAFYYSIPDISLYEHSRLTAALAICMYDFVAERNNNVIPEGMDLAAVKGLRNEPSFLLLCGDITGIQKYIYNVGHSGAMKALKGRSFWLQQIVDSIAFSILDSCGLYHANLLFSTGGKFCLLLPNTQKIAIEIDDLQIKLENKLLEEYDGSLSLVFGKLAVSGSEILGQVNERWEKLFQITDEAKTRKYNGILNNPSFFQPGELHGALELCQATKREILLKEELLNLVRENADVGSQHFDRVISKSGREAFEELEENRTHTNRYISEEQHLAIRVGYDIRNNKTALVKTKNFGYNVLDLEEIDFKHPSEIKSYQRLTERILYLNDDNHLNDFQNKSILQGWRFYGGDWRFDDSFEELIKSAYKFQRLGILRMDVDNLGHIFHKGLKNPAFSRIVQLSTMIDFFFSSYLNKLKTCWWCLKKGVVESEKEAEGEEKISLEKAINIVYAGGDDLFIVGVWNVLPDVARWIHDKFTAFTCDNPDFTLSAGISLFENKFPLYKAAKYAQDALDEAKSWRMPNEQKARKNSICFMGVPMRWNDFEFVQEWSKQWAAWISAKQISKGFLNVLEALYADYDDHRQLIGRLKKLEGPEWHKNHINIPSDPLWGRWRWRGCYFLSRFSERIKGDEVLKESIQKFASRLFSNQFERDENGGTVKIERNCIDILPVALRWADYLTRTKSEE